MSIVLVPRRSPRPILTPLSPIWQRLPPALHPRTRTYSWRPQKSDSPLGVEAVLRAKEDKSFEVKSRIFDEFKLDGRVGMVTGGNGGLGLEMALALCEAGGTVHALDLPTTPSQEFKDVQSYISQLPLPSSSSTPPRLFYHSANVTSQSSLENLVTQTIIPQSGRMDFVVAAAGILGPPSQTTCLTLKAEDWEKVFKVNTDGVFYTAQAGAKGILSGETKGKGKGKGGSIILIASMSGSITNRDHPWTAYNSSKSAVLQMGRSMACELGKDGIRVNTISPGHIYTKMTAQLLDKTPDTGEVWARSNPLGRLGQVHELRGVVTWLASDASSFCTGSDIMVTGGHHAW